MRTRLIAILVSEAEACMKPSRMLEVLYQKFFLMNSASMWLTIVKQSTPIAVQVIRRIGR